MRRTFLAAAIVLVTLAACSLPTVDKVADAKAQALYAQIRTGADLAQNTDLAPSLRTPAALAQLASVKDALPAGAPTATVNRSWNFYSGTNGTTATLVHAYSYPDQTVLAQTVLAKGKGGVWLITGFHVAFEGAGNSAPPAVTVTKPSQTT
jgi:hypothetical protein